MSWPFWKPTRRSTKRLPPQPTIRRFWFRYQADTGLAAAADRHVALIRAILGGDADEAGAEAGRLMALLRRHAETVATQQ